MYYKRTQSYIIDTIFGGNPQKRVFIIFLINPPLLPEHPPSFPPIFINPTRYEHLDFADLTINLSTAPVTDYKGFTIKRKYTNNRAWGNTIYIMVK